MRRLAGSFAVLFAGLLTAGTARGHDGHSTHESGTGAVAGADPLSLALLLSGVLVFGAGLYLAAREDVDRIYALSGVAIGLTGVAVALVLYLRQGF